MVPASSSSKITGILFNRNEIDLGKPVLTQPAMALRNCCLLKKSPHILSGN